jgi:hypothetical protein
MNGTYRSMNDHLPGLHPFSQNNKQFVLICLRFIELLLTRLQKPGTLDIKHRP